MTYQIHFDEQLKLTKKWETLLSKERFLHVESIAPNGILTLVVRCLSPSAPWNRYRVRFPHALAYRMLLEPYAIEGEHYTKLLLQHGPTLQIDNSPWIAQLNELSNCKIEIDFELTNHLQILTEKWIIEVLCGDVPIVEELEPLMTIDSEANLIEF